MVDDPGLTVLPAFEDTHTHLIFAGRAVHDVQVADTRDLGEFLGPDPAPGRQHAGRAVDPHRVKLA